MKTSGIIIIAMLLTANVYSQDNIYTKKGDVIPAKVLEIGQDDIKYKKESNPDGPLYTLSKSDVTLIEYKNGMKDIFSGSGQPSGNNADYSSSQNSQQVVNNNYYAGGY